MPHELDYLSLLRFCAANVVLAAHFGIVSDTSILLHSHRLGAFAAVLIFLICSGYIVQCSLSRFKDGFMLRRFCRIYPAYALAIVIYAILSLIIDGRHVSSIGIEITAGFDLYTTIVNLLLGQNIFAPQMFGVLWSIQVELILYAIVSIAAFQGSSKNTLIEMLILISLGGYCLHGYLGLPYFADINPFITAGCLGGFFLIGLQCCKRRSVVYSIYALALINIAFTFYAPQSGEFTKVFFFISTAFVLFARHFRQLGASAARASRYLGDVSYPLFIYHFPIILFMDALALNKDTMLYVCSCFTVALFSMHLLENKARAWSRRTK